MTRHSTPPPVAPETDSQEAIARRLRRSEADLADALDLLQAVSDASPGGIVAYRSEGPCVLANAAAARIVGATQEQLLQENFRQLDSWNSSGLLAAADLALDQGGVVHQELHTVSTFGSEVFLQCKLTTFESRGELHLLLAYEDITDKRSAELAMTRALDDLERSNHELEMFAYVASHDLQEPLRMVASFTQLLADRYGDQLDQRAQMYIGHAVEGALRMRRLINSLLALSRVRQYERPMKQVNCSALLKQVRQDLALVIQETGARIQVGDLPIIRGNAPQLRQLFQNLLDNALKFRAEDPPLVEISATRGADGWIFEVSDNGIGIPGQYLERIFAPFQRLHLRQEYLGDGIGLAIARRVVEGHGGRIQAKSPPGGGACFIFDIPDDGGVDWGNP